MARTKNRRKPKNLTADYRRIRAGFVARGTTVAEWATACGIRPSSAYDALRGRRTGPISAEIVRRALEYVR